MSNIIQLPPQTEKRPELLFGPFETWRVLCMGRLVPKLTGNKHEDGSVSLTVDGRFGATFVDEETADQAVWLIAQASAIHAGYSHFEADNKDMPFAGRCFSIGTVEIEP